MVENYGEWRVKFVGLALSVPRGNHVTRIGVACEEVAGERKVPMAGAPGGVRERRRKWLASELVPGAASGLVCPCPRK